MDDINIVKDRRSIIDNSSHDEGAIWYKDAIIYQVHVRSFYDSNADGIGDFVGLTQKLDYIQFLGINTIWLLPFYPSPLKDDGYDIADFTDVNPIYGTLVDFKNFLREAHKRDMRVMTELVLNHTSSAHSWFQKSRSAKPNSHWRNFYVWNPTPDRNKEARIIFKDFENSNWTWDPVAQAYYWHRFYSHQPDLNYDNPDVHNAMLKVVDFWFNLGIDGVRLDAVPYLYEREGTNCENLPETHEFLKKLRSHVDKKFKNKFLLAEANQWPEDASKYFGDGDECNMAFHFPMMPRMFMSLQMEDRFPLIDILQQTPEIPYNCQWATFLRNHDELTLEMVTDEERDYMYRVYAKDTQMRINLGIRRRLAPLLNGDRKKIELMNALLFSLPGAPIIYYGDEIGMGDNIYLGDRNGVRTPMQWERFNPNSGFSDATPQKLFLPVIIDPEYNYGIINVELQEQNSESLLWWMKNLIDLRSKFKAFSRGKLEFLFPENHKILSFLRIYEQEHILVVINLSRFIQYAELDLSAYQGKNLVELFGGTHFPKIKDSPYFLTLAPYSFYYFAIEPDKSAQLHMNQQTTVIKIENHTQLFNRSSLLKLESILIGYLYGSRWFSSKQARIKKINISDVAHIDSLEYQNYMLYLDVDYYDKESETYFLPITIIDTPNDNTERYQNSIIAHIESGNSKGVLVDSLLIPEICYKLLKTCVTKKQIKSNKGYISFLPTSQFRTIFSNNSNLMNLKVIQSEQSNTSVYNEQGILKFYRRLEAGTNPDVEITRILTEKTNFKATPRFGGSIEYHRDGTVTTCAMLQNFISNQGTAWEYARGSIVSFYDKVREKKMKPEGINLPVNPLTTLIDEVPHEVYALLGQFASSVHLLGSRTAELHSALTIGHHDQNFCPENFTLFDQRSLYQSIRTKCLKCFDVLSKKMSSFDKQHRSTLEYLLDSQNEVYDLAKQILHTKIEGYKIRCHGDYHLGQVLYTGNDFVIIDFEGEPAKPLSERRIKRSPLVDVAGMLRSFHYAISIEFIEKSNQLPEFDVQQLVIWSDYWFRWVSHIFLKGYFNEINKSNNLLPQTQEKINLLLKMYMLEKVIYELNYELNNRPNWIGIPSRGVLELIGK